MKTAYTLMNSPVGTLTLVAGEHGLRAILWENDRANRVPLGGMDRDDAHPLLVEADSQLRRYFAGELREFSLPLEFVGTEFQKSVWRELTAIPFGETRSYRDIATRIGNPKAVRAVGAANGKNPISIVAPCHRVIGSNGTLTGFAGGMKAKSYLLNLERGVGGGVDQGEFAPEFGR